VDNVPYLEAQNLTRPRQTTQFSIAWLASGNQQDAADLQQRCAQLGDDRQRPESSCGGNVELLPAGPASVVLKAGMDDPNVSDPEPCGRRCNPVQPPSLRVHEREGCIPERQGKWEAREPSARSQIHPLLTSCGCAQSSKTESVVNVAFAEALTFTGAKEPEIDSIQIGMLQVTEQ
jgi:hypothetical protein